MWPDLQEGEPAAGGKCTRTGSRRAPAALVPKGTDVVAVRISAPGWENAILDGLQVILSAAFPQLYHRSTVSMNVCGIRIFVPRFPDQAFPSQVDSLSQRLWHPDLGSQILDQASDMGCKCTGCCDDSVSDRLWHPNLDLYIKLANGTGSVWEGVTTVTSLCQRHIVSWVHCSR